jgi:glycosyltransferase involved in cell wall biosynthesis
MTGIITPFLHGKKHHVRYSGPERLVEFYSNCRVYSTAQYKKIPILLFPLRVLRILPSMYRTFKAEIDCLKQNDKIIHLYGEDTYLLSGFRLFRKNKKIFVMFHQPDKRFRRKMPFYWRSLLRDVDIITVSPSQKRFFMKYFPESKVHLIPLGIDVHYFKPNKKVKKKQQIIAVGDHLRDYNTLLRAMEIVKKELPNLKLIIVAKITDKRYDANYEIRKNVSDPQLLALYQESLFQVLPLKTVTASLALLEGCACGLPLISIDSENVKFYLSNAITYADYQNLAAKIIQTYNNIGKLSSNIDHLSWENIIKKIKSVIDRTEKGDSVN